MTPSYIHASESYVLIGHESALFHVLPVSVSPRVFPDTPPYRLMVNMRLIVLRIMWYLPLFRIGTLW
jgi:hypothetical protein